MPYILNTDSFRIDKEKIISLLRPIAAEFRLEMDVVVSIVHAESGFGQWKTRFEPGWRYFYQSRSFAEKLGVSMQTEEAQQATSFGVMQVMGAVARELGFQDDLTMLCEPIVGAYYGCKKLRQLFDKYEIEPDAISAYNQGTPRKTKGLMYENQKYLDKVYNHLNQLRTLRVS